MKTLPAVFLACALALPAFAANDEKETDRVKESGVVLKEILNIPDDIPQDLLDKAECVIVLPSVKKGAIGIGGSYGRGVMICRGGQHYTGRWGAPALYALEGINIGFQLGGQATDFVLLVMNPKGAESLLSSKVSWARTPPQQQAQKDALPKPPPTLSCRLKCSPTRAPKACLPGSLWKARHCARTEAPTKNFTDKNSARKTLSAAAK